MRNPERSAMREALRDAAYNVVSYCLKVTPGEEVAIICEQDRLIVAENLAYALLRKKAHPIVLPIFKENRSILNELKGELTIPSSLHACLDRVTVIVTLIEHRVGELGFRRQILEHIENNVCRIVHMPGITTEQFAEYLRGDFEEMDRCGRKLAIKLEQNIGKTFRLTSNAGTDLTLNVTPHIHLSSGIIDKPGQLGNLPGGEVYFVPAEGSANGKVVIDVSIPNFVVSGTDLAITIPIRDGKVKLSALHDPTNLLQQHYQKEGADVLCEVGIGLNDQIQKATGISLIDEKIGGTVHVAFGDNTFFGGSNKSSVHMDMVLQSPSMTINGEPIMDSGEWALELL